MSLRDRTIAASENGGSHRSHVGLTTCDSYHGVNPPIVISYSITYLRPAPHTLLLSKYSLALIIVSLIRYQRASEDARRV